MEDNNQKKVLYDKYLNCFECEKGILNINCIKHSMATELFDTLYSRSYIKEINIYIDDINLLNNILHVINKHKSKNINIYINNNDNINHNLISDIKNLKSNAKIKYKRLISYSKEKRLIKVENINVYDFDTILLNLSNSELEKVISKFDEESKRYILLEKEIVKKVYTLSKRKYPNLDELDEEIKKNIIFNYIKNIKIEDTNEMSDDPLYSFIKKEGSVKGISKLFELLLNNKYFNVKDANYIEYNENQKSNTLNNKSAFTA